MVVLGWENELWKWLLDCHVLAVPSLSWWLSSSRKGRDREKAVRGRMEGELGKRSEGFLCFKNAPYFLLLAKTALNLIIKKCHMKGVESGMPHGVVCVSPLLKKKGLIQSMHLKLRVAIGSMRSLSIQSIQSIHQTKIC